MKNFIKKKENFVCERCGQEVVGNGYTDHCPNCLWGKHMDEEVPGDRKSRCRGMMEPIKAIYEKGKFRINYRCQKCGHEFWVGAATVKSSGGSKEEDNREKLMELLV